MDTATIAQIDAEIDAATDLLTKLRARRAVAVVTRRDAIIKAFDDGGARAQIVEAFGGTYQDIADILHKAGRNERQRRAIGLGPRQRADYERLIRQGVKSSIASVIAKAVTA